MGGKGLTSRVNQSVLMWVREKSSHLGVSDHQALSCGPFHSDISLNIPWAQASWVDLLEQNVPCPYDKVVYLFALKLRSAAIKNSVVAVI